MPTLKSPTRPLLITGMFRSGTTLLAMMCQNHPRMRVAADPYANLFRAFRNTVAAGAGLPFDDAAPMSDYYFEPAQLALMRKIQQTGLDARIQPEICRWLAEHLDETARRYAPELPPFPADALAGGTFKELFERAFRHIAESAERRVEVAGFKQVWMGEFTRHILEAFPEARVIHVIRDPRAVCASKQKRDAKYPWLFLIRHWRKHAVCAWKASRENPGLAGRTLVIRYEDLVTQSESAARQICKFLNVDFEPAMIDASQFRDGAGKPWAANSAHEQNLRAIEPDLAGRWESVLDEREIRFVETLCAPEMAALDYQRKFPFDVPLALSALMDPPRAPDHELAAWIRPYAGEYQDMPQAHAAAEWLRLESVRMEGAIPNEMKELLFLDAAFFDAARKKIGQPENQFVLHEDSP